MEKARPSKLATSILMVSSVAVIVEYLGPIMVKMHTRLNVPTVAMCMGQMGLTCTRGGVPSVKKGRRGSGTGGSLRSETIRNRQILQESETERYLSWPNVKENSLQLKRQKKSAGGKNI